MDIELIYRIFYILFAMEVVAVVLFPLLLILRIIMQNFPQKYTVWMWRLYYFRIICPIAISSPFCIAAQWNRWYHRLLEGLGLTMEEESGLLRSWSSVLHGEITTTFSYRVCAWGWLFGVAFILIVMIFRQGRIRKEIRTREKQLEGRLYQSAVTVPAMTGIIRQRYYLPENTEAKQARYTVAHMEIHNKQKSALWHLIVFLITALHWFDPLVWAALRLSRTDEEMACDEGTIRRLGIKEKGAYTQSILNMAKEETPVPYTICTIFETGLGKRAQRALHWKLPSIGKRMTGVLMVSLISIYFFMLRPMQIVWAGGTWQQGQNEVVQRTLRESETVAQVSVTSPGGLQNTLKLNVEKGTQTGNEVRGRFSLVLEDSMGDPLDEVFLKDEFQKQGIDLDVLSFSQGLVLHTGDYNNDNVQELIIGQQTDWNDEQRDEVQNIVSTGEETSPVPNDEGNGDEVLPAPGDERNGEEASPTPKDEQKKSSASPTPKDGQKKSSASPTPKDGQKKSSASPTPKDGQKKSSASPTPKDGQKKSSASPTPKDGQKKSSASPTPKDEQKKNSASPTPKDGQKKSSASPTPKDEQKKNSASPTPKDGQKTSKSSAPESGDKGIKENTTNMKEYVYLVFQLEETSIETVSDPVYGQQMPGMETIVPGMMEDIKDIFFTSTDQGHIYYVWDQTEQRYTPQRLGEDQLNQHRLASQGTQESGIEETYTLTDSDGEKMRVETMTDTTGSKAIQRVIMTRGEREMKAVEGYYCDLQWAIQSDASIGKYAILTYNGRKAQTFVIYDIENREEFYRHEDGNTVLNSVFGQYNDSEIQFEPGSAVVYTLLEQKDTLLTISFAAQAEGDITVRGVYDYDTEKEMISNLQFSQSGGTGGNGSSAQPENTAGPIPTINSDLEQYLQQ